MGAIYRRAQRVIFRLSDHENDGQLLMSSTPDLMLRLKRYEESFSNGGVGDFSTTGLAGLDDTIFPALESLYSRSWFGRLWVFQEASLAPELVLMRGRSCIQWRELSSLTQIPGGTNLIDLVLTTESARAGVMTVLEISHFTKRLPQHLF